MILLQQHFRAMIYYDFKAGLNPRDCLQRLTTALGNEAPSKTTVCKWYQEFRCGRTSLEDQDRPGRPPTATTAVQEEAVARLVEEDGHITIDMIANEINISHGSVHEILHERLKMRRISARWVPHLLTAEQMATRVEWCQSMLQRYRRGNARAIRNIITGDETWVYSYDPQTKQQSSQWQVSGTPPPLKCVRERSSSKQMVATFASPLVGHLITVPVELQKTVTANWYTTECLPRVKAAADGHNIAPMILHHDNAAAHRAQQTTFWLNDNGVHLMTHPPYSPDLAPCDFFIFNRVKTPLRGIRFGEPQEAVAAFQHQMNQISAPDWAICFQKWFKRMQKCIDCDGKYFEKL